MSIILVRRKFGMAPNLSNKDIYLNFVKIKTFSSREVKIKEI